VFLFILHERPEEGRTAFAEKRKPAHVDITGAEKVIFSRLLEKGPAFAPPSGASRRQADAS